ncbi:MAG TPA: lipopolysaccharide biosynthesis protein [Patescibacteria group bacterium]|nr:lipopolysaccharide biosynthesis protein [Patescibacteria group bacterium]
MFNKVVTHFKNEHLYRNSLYMMASTGVLALSGFIFWIVAAHFFSTNSVGIATALISAITLIGGFSQLGFNISLIRFLPNSNEADEMILSSYLLVFLASIIGSLLFILGLPIFAPDLIFLNSNLIYIITFTIFVCAIAINSVLDSTYMAYRTSENVLIKNTIISILKLVFLFLLTSFGAYGLFSSVSLATTIGVFVSMSVLFYRLEIKPRFKINKKIVKDMAAYSVGNYISGFLYQIPTLILPLVIINKLNATFAAYFYIDSMILNLLVIIPLATSQILLAEGSHDLTQIKTNLFKSIKITFITLVPAIIIIFFFGNILLQFFGKSYEADAFHFLQIISLSAVFISITLFCNSILRLYHELKLLIILNLIGAIIIILACFISVPYGLVGVGYGWLIGQILTALLFLFSTRKHI